MKILTALIGSLVVVAGLPAGAQTPPAATADSSVHRYVVERTFAPGPSEASIRRAASANGLPVDSITEVPVTLLPK